MSREKVRAFVPPGTKVKGRRLRTLAGKRLPVPTEWSVELVYKLCEDFATVDKSVFRVAKPIVGKGGYSDASGAGWGDRDHRWQVKDAVTAGKLARALRRLSVAVPACEGLRITVQAPPKVVFDAGPVS